MKKARNAAGMTQKELADRLGVYPKDISRWENGERTPSAVAFGNICRELHASADEILELGVDTGSNRLIYPAIFSPCEDKDGYTVVVPDLPGCVTEGDTLADAFAMVIDAASGWVLGEIRDGNSIPDATPFDQVAHDPDSFVHLIVLQRRLPCHY
jgi:predicted RNase H-like HicB family nuclease/DNA-binding Xre family transcriptional regulator